MSIIGHGIDIEDLKRFSFLANEDWMARVFTVAEFDSIPSGERRLKHIASRFAAKEAAMKAFGLSFGPGASFKDFEIYRESGCAPELRLSARMRKTADQLGVSVIVLSISHSETSVVASVIVAA